MATTADDGRRPIGFDQTEMAEASICQTQISSTLPQAVVSDLCRRDLVPPNVGRCDLTNLQLQRQNVETIIRAAAVVGKSTHTSLKIDFGNYETTCSGVNPFGNDYTCQYDLSGIGPYVEVSYDASTQIVKAISSHWSDCSQILR